MSALPADGKAGGRRAVIVWSGMIAGLLLLQVALCTIGTVCAVRGGGVMVENDYYNKALHWDEHEALVQASAALEWKVDLTVGDAATTKGDRAILLKLVDKAGAPVEGAEVSLAYFHHARPRELFQIALKSLGDGAYGASAPLDRRGIWEFRLTVHRKAPVGSEKTGVETFVATLQRDLLE